MRTWSGSFIVLRWRNLFPWAIGWCRSFYGRDNAEEAEWGRRCDAAAGDKEALAKLREEMDERWRRHRGRS